VDEQSIRLHRTADPAEIGWQGVDVVLECSGRFARRPELEGHLRGTVKLAVLGRPGEVDQTIVIGVNDSDLDLASRTLSAGSCTTNAVAPVLAVLDQAFGLRWGLIGTVHATTAGQHVVDGAAADLRRGRAAAHNIIPTTTGAVRAVAQVLPALAGKIDGHSVRVPVVDGSLFDVTCTLGDSPGLERVLDALRSAAADPRFHGVLDVRDEPLVSSDIIGDRHSCIVDERASLASGPLVRIVGWYDNEGAYAARLLDVVSVWGRARAEAGG
jgi:glyceraldehyde 3-phosphate dehydrogenase